MIVRQIHLIVIAIARAERELGHGLHLGHRLDAHPRVVVVGARRGQLRRALDVRVLEAPLRALEPARVALLVRLGPHGRSVCAHRRPWRARYGVARVVAPVELLPRVALRGGAEAEPRRRLLCGDQLLAYRARNLVSTRPWNWGLAGAGKGFGMFAIRWEALIPGEGALW
eukprot:CAMPEP_0118934542 /NCGR_PEP_ID=MMETSP1169-20130426/13883_1 /TAXON_ID=36882 /ORGANISM="Pyramimonas obovata, Strain CCMP722" /LENGTH=169 /DNA_ID=CAMNT_0006877459 /DNA_START=415 /DNA_END=921 /DNA_ORIENTATION=+